jgi:hypothetical protein
MALNVELLQYYNINSFQAVTQVTCSEDEAVDVYFRLVDTTKKENNYDVTNLRYIPQGATTNTVSVILRNIDDSKQITRSASAVSSTTDLSLWKVQILSTDNITGTISLKVTLTETSSSTVVTKKCNVLAAVNITSTGSSC